MAAFALVLANLTRRQARVCSRNTRLFFLFKGSYCMRFSTVKASRQKNANISVTFVDRDGQRVEMEAKEGQTLLDVAVNNDLGIEGFGACGGSLSCSTCHLILSPEDYAKLEPDLGEEEMDLLDLSNHVTETSRLGCQVRLTPQLNGMVVTLPRHVNDARDLSQKAQDRSRD